MEGGLEDHLHRIQLPPFIRNGLLKIVGLIWSAGRQREARLAIFVNLSDPLSEAAQIGEISTSCLLSRLGAVMPP